MKNKKEKEKYMKVSTKIYKENSLNNIDIN